MEAPLPRDEEARLRDLRAMNVLDRGPNAVFDRITGIAARVFDVPIALVSFVDADRQWFGSRVGLDAPETPRCDAFCAHTILQPVVMEVNDATVDPRFADNPLVTGEPNIRFYAGAPIASPSGHRLGTLCIIDRTSRHLDDLDKKTLRDLADLIERELSLVELALTDSLTGLANRRAFVEAGRRLLPLSSRRSEPMSVLVADVDGLKGVNDNHGHQVGDQLVQRAATVLLSALRESDIVARVGGDEFMVLLYGTDDAGAARVAETLQTAVDDHNRARPDLPALSLSAGYAQADDAGNLDEVIERADAAMYRAKRSLQQRSS